MNQRNFGRRVRTRMRKIESEIPRWLKATAAPASLPSHRMTACLSRECLLRVLKYRTLASLSTPLSLGSCGELAAEMLPWTYPSSRGKRELERQTLSGINIFTNPKETPAPEGLSQGREAIRLFSELMFLLMGGGEALKSPTGKVGKVADCLAGQKGEGKNILYAYFIYTWHTYLPCSHSPCFQTSKIHVMRKTLCNLEYYSVQGVFSCSYPPPQVESTSPPNNSAIMHISD